MTTNQEQPAGRAEREQDQPVRPAAGGHDFGGENDLTAEFTRRRHGRRRDRRGGHGRGDVKSAVLALLAEKPRHGYELIQEISARTDGAWQPSPGSVYPTIAALQDRGFVLVEADESGRRVVTLTQTGSGYATEHADELRSVFDSTGRGRGDAQRNLIAGMRGVNAATKQVAQVGTPSQIAAAGALLQDTKRRLYAILAELSADSTDEVDDEADSDRPVGAGGVGTGEPAS